MTEPDDRLAIVAAAMADPLEELMSRPLSEADIESATRDMAAPLELASRDRRSVLVFVCGGELFAIGAVDVAKVVPGGKIHRVPHRTNQVFRGVCNTDGEILLCMDLEQTLGLPRPTEEALRFLVVVGGPRERWAFLVDRIVGVADIAEHSLRPAPVTVGAARSGCVTALASTEDGEASLLDLGRLSGIFRGGVS